MPIVPPAGISPAATFQPWSPVAGTPPPQILAEKRDPTTGELLSLFEGAPPVVALLVEQLRTVRGSGASVADVGTAIADIRYNDDQAPAKLLAEMHRILDPMVAAGQLQVLELDVAAGPAEGDLGAVYLRFRDLVTATGGPGATFVYATDGNGKLTLTPDSPDTSP